MRVVPSNALGLPTLVAHVAVIRDRRRVSVALLLVRGTTNIRLHPSSSSSSSRQLLSGAIELADMGSDDTGHIG